MFRSRKKYSWAQSIYTIKVKQNEQNTIRIEHSNFGHSKTLLLLCVAREFYFSTVC